MKNIIILVLFLSYSIVCSADNIKFYMKSNPKITADYKGKVKEGKANGYGSAVFYLDGVFDGEYE